MNAKKFTLYMVYAISGFVLFNFIVWHLYVEKILVHKDGMISGDLARMGYLPQFIHLRKNSTDLPRLHKEISEYQNESIDILTIGDSFSNGGAFGYNRFYQDYFATDLNWTVVNINQHPQTKNYMETIILLANSGFFAKRKVKYILIESFERKVVERHSGVINYKIALPLEKIDSFYRIGKDDVKHRSLSNGDDANVNRLPEVGFINNGNFKYVAYNLLYHFSDRAFLSKTHHVKLSKELFSIGSGKELLFYHRSVNNMMKDHTEKNLNEVNDNLNRLADFLASKYGIKLIFMPVVTKYDLYSPYIVDNQYGEDPFFGIYRKLPKKYIFIDTKAILSKELIRGEKDIYYCDDMHWSYKASKVISKSFSNQIKGK